MNISETGIAEAMAALLGGLPIALGYGAGGDRGTVECAENAQGLEARDAGGRLTHVNKQLCHLAWAALTGL